MPGLQHIQTLDDEYVALTDDPGLPCNDVVFDVRVEGNLQMLLSGFCHGHELEQGFAVVTLRETFALHQPTLDQDRVGQEKAVCCHQVNLRVLGPTSEKGLQHTRDRRLPHSDGTSDADDERDRPRRCAEKRVGDTGELITALHAEVEQPRERQERALDHVYVEGDVDASELVDVLLVEGERCVGPELSPRVAVKVEVARTGHAPSG